VWLLKTSLEAEENLRREARAAGIDSNRLIFAARLEPIERHIALLAVADLFLDSYPYGAHTPANDALLAGLRLITHPRATLASPLAGCQLHAIGMPKLVTSNSADYEALARRLAHNRGELAALRARLAANRETQPLFDKAACAHDLKETMRRVWREFAGSLDGNSRANMLTNLVGYHTLVRIAHLLTWLM
jgi:predicted O-linked N-acetylglucosamine transferase (SPINDLY family)